MKNLIKKILKESEDWFDEIDFSTAESLLNSSIPVSIKIDGKRYAIPDNDQYIDFEITGWDGWYDVVNIGVYRNEACFIVNFGGEYSRVYMPISDFTEKDMKYNIKESEDEFDWVEAPDLEDKSNLERILRSLLKESGFQLTPIYNKNNRYLTINDLYIDNFGNPIKYGSDGALYYVFPAELFSKEYLKNRLEEHNSKFPTPESFHWALESKRQYYYDKYKLIFNTNAK